MNEVLTLELQRPTNRPVTSIPPTTIYAKGALSYFARMFASEDAEKVLTDQIAIVASDSFHPNIEAREFTRAQVGFLETQRDNAKHSRDLYRSQLRNELGTAVYLVDSCPIDIVNQLDQWWRTECFTPHMIFSIFSMEVGDERTFQVAHDHDATVSRIG